MTVLLRGYGTVVLLNVCSSFSSSGLRNKNLALQIRSNKGNYPGKKVHKSILFSIAQKNGKPTKVVINNRIISKGSDLTDQKKRTYLYSEDGLIYLLIDFSDSAVNITITW